MMWKQFFLVMLFGFQPIFGETTYDYIVVGSGSAGSALTSELVKNPNVRVLLLESGGEPFVGYDVPMFAPLQQFTPQNWGYLMEKQDNFCLGLTDELMAWPRGHVYGGSSVINMMIHIRGNPLDYDLWENLGNPGWSYNDVLPIFKELEDTHVSINDEEYRGKGGPLTASDIPYRTKSVDVFIQAANESGYPYVDYNGKSQMGVSYIQGTIRNGRRWSADKAFMRPIQFQSNLQVRLYAHVTKVLINPSSKTAYGVEVVQNGITYRVNAAKEVILCAGAFHSPQILMLSGIGPKEHLDELGIPVVQNLPVGKKLYDHLTFLGLIFTVNSDIVVSFTKALLSMGQWLLFGDGPLTLLTGVESVAYFKTTAAKYPENYPDMELIFLGGHLHSDNDLAFRKMFRVSDKVYNALWKPLENKWAFGILPMLLHPKSVGEMKLRSKNPFDPPKFYGNYLTDPDGDDLTAFLDAINESKRIISAPAFKQYNATLLNVPVPGCEHLTFDTRSYWECALRHISATLHHQISTCKMGNASDPEAVVNHKLQVYGVKNLRVVDISVIPTTISGHTNIPAYMIGRKGARLILQDDLV